MANVAKANLKFRSKLKPRPRAYFQTIAAKRLLGYLRASASAAGRWLVQVEIGRQDNGQPIRRREILGTADDFVAANGADVLDFEQARDLASKWSADAKVSAALYTVQKACEDYIAAFAVERGQRWSRDVWNALRWNVLRQDSNGKARSGDKGLGASVIEQLNADDFRAWRDALVTNHPGDARLARSTANRIVAPFKAALNHAFNSNKVKSDVAWRQGLGAFRNVDAPRVEHFSAVETLALIEKAREFDVAFAVLCEGAFLIGARYGELCALSVRDFNAKRGVVVVPARSEEFRIKNEVSRDVYLNSEGVEFFAKLVAGRAGDEPMFALDGERWGPWHQQARMKRALAAAGLSADATFYAFRHSHISRALENGAEISFVADNCGTSVGQIEKHYKHVTGDRSRQMASRMPNLRGASNVAPIKRAA